MPTRFSLPHIDIASFVTTQDYQGSGSGGGGGARERIAHGQRLQNELTAALALMDAVRPNDERLDASKGAYVEVELEAGSKADTLDSKTSNIKSGAVKLAENNERVVAVWLPDDARSKLDEILHQYLTGELSKAGNPPNKAKVEAIAAFRAARLETLWTDDPAALPPNANDIIWWGVWCWKGGEDQVVPACERLGLRVASRDRWLLFPEAVVVPILARRADIELLIFATGAIAELRRASDSPVFFVDQMASDAIEWSDDLAARITWPGSDAPAVCVFDTGINRAHALIEPALAIVDMHTIDTAWEVDDHSDAGHGTSMAGLALHGDLVAALADQSKPELRHRLESVKVLPPSPFDPNEPHTYGSITQAAVALPEITAPDRARIFCMAVSNENVSGALPSSWSAAIDQAAAGTMVGDDVNAPKRLIVLSGGNIPPELDMARLRSQDEYPIEDPAQAWNALSVGGYTDMIHVREAGYEDWGSLAPAGGLSPYSRTSATWPRNAPFKPEIVMEAGNRGVSPSKRDLLSFPSLSVCTTGKDVGAEPLVSFQATSAATAQAARLAARLAADHPEFWPETIRALIVHSAHWTPPMVDALNACRTKDDRCALIRQFGYGVPDYERATASANHHLALFAQSEIQPFKLKGTRKFNECHYFDLPIPRGMLEGLENSEVQLKITLSYFIDPNPGMSANIDPQRYQSHGLRFDLRRKGEPADTFRERVNVSERDDPRARLDLVVADDNRWMLGPKSISAGSLHCDVWTGPAIELAGRDMLCIKPVGGWCRDRSTKEVCNSKRRYSLIVTLQSADVEVDLYTPIKTLIDIPTEIQTEV